MPHQDCPGILQVDMNYMFDNQRISNIFHVGKNDPSSWDSTDIQDVLDAFYATYWTANQMDLLPTPISLVEIVGTDLTSLEGDRVVMPISPAEPGTNASPALPANATIAIHFSVSRRGRGVTGRMFWPLLTEAVVVNNKVDSSYIASIVATLNAIKTELLTIAGGSALCVLSRVLNGVPRAEGIGQAIQAFGVTDDTVDSQRNRLPNHKRHKRSTAP